MYEVTPDQKDFVENEALDAHEWRGLCELGKAIRDFEPLEKRINLGETVLKRLIKLGLAEEGPTSPANQARKLHIGYRQTYLGMLVQERGQHPRRKNG